MSKMQNGLRATEINKARALLGHTDADAASIWAVALSRQGDSASEVRDLAEMIAWQGVEGDQAARARWRGQFAPDGTIL
jgi:hypothetical protein